jgi:ketosteroid isomerase-like protein
MSHTNREKIIEEALKSSRNWIANFNNGNARACIDAYTNDAIMNARPFGNVQGHMAVSPRKGKWRYIWHKQLKKRG